MFLISFNFSYTAQVQNGRQASYRYTTSKLVNATISLDVEDIYGPADDVSFQKYNINFYLRLSQLKRPLNSKQTLISTIFRYSTSIECWALLVWRTPSVTIFHVTTWSFSPPLVLNQRSTVIPSFASCRAIQLRRQVLVCRVKFLLPGAQFSILKTVSTF